MKKRVESTERVMKIAGRERDQISFENTYILTGVRIRKGRNPSTLLILHVCVIIAEGGREGNLCGVFAVFLHFSWLLALEY